jgi:hypothetical protein
MVCFWNFLIPFTIPFLGFLAPENPFPADDCKAYIIYGEKDMHAKKSSLFAFIRHFELWCDHKTGRNSVINVSLYT